MKVKTANLFIAGAHRGGRAFTDSYLNRFPPPEKVVVVDPKGERARVLAERWHRHGSNALHYAEPCQNLLEKVKDNYVGMLSVDSVVPMVEVIENTCTPMQWQILGRSTNNIILGFSGTLVEQDGDFRSSSTTLLRNLSPYALPVSSHHVRTSLLSDSVLGFTRGKISDHSAESIFELAQGRGRGGLRLFFGTQNYPLVVLKGQIEPFREVEKRAIEVNHPQVNDSLDFAVAVVLTNQVEVFCIETYGNKRGIKFYTTFGQPIPSPLLTESGRRVGTSPQLFSTRRQVSTVVTD